MGNELPDALKTFRHEFDIRVFIDKNSGDWHMPMEWHTSLEIFMCIKGQGTYYIGNKVYDFIKGDIFVISNNELHKSEINEGGAFDAFVIMFSPEKVLSSRYIQGKDLLDIFSEFLQYQPGHTLKNSNFLLIRAISVTKFLCPSIEDIQQIFPLDEEDGKHLSR